MDEPLTVREPGPLSWVGCGCGGIGALLALGGMGTFVAIALGVFNYSVETGVAIGGGSALCVGFFLAVLGIALYYFGGRDVPAG